MPQQEVDLTKLFTAVTKALKTEQAALNEADTYNHDHGDNMVKNFKVITKAVKQMEGTPPSERLTYASEVLRKKSSTGSANLYAQGLEQAAGQLKGQRNVNAGNAMNMIQALIGSGGQPAAQGENAASGDSLGSLLGGLMGGGQSSGSGQSTGGGGSGDMLSGLMGSLLGGGAGGGQSASGGGLDLGSLLSAGASLLGGGGGQSASGGGLGSLVGSLVGGSSMNDSAHHSQSGNVVVSTLIGALGKMLAGK